MDYALSAGCIIIKPDHQSKPSWYQVCALPHGNEHCGEQLLHAPGHVQRPRPGIHNNRHITDTASVPAAHEHKPHL